MSTSPRDAQDDAPEKLEDELEENVQSAEASEPGWLPQTAVRFSSLSLL